MVRPRFNCGLTKTYKRTDLLFNISLIKIYLLIKYMDNILKNASYLFNIVNIYKTVLFQHQKTRVWPIRLKFSLLYVEEQSISAPEIRGKFLKNLFSQNLQLFVYKKHAES